MNPFWTTRRIYAALVFASLGGFSTAHLPNLPTSFADLQAVSPHSLLGSLKGLVIPRAADEAYVQRVVDGDTFVARVGEKSLRVRIIGIDTPESVKPGTPVRCFAKRASHASKARLTGRSVRLIYDIDKRDRYGRALAYVELRGHDYGAWLLKHGYARSLEIPPNIARASSYDDLQRTAQRSGRGLWGSCTNAFGDDQ